MKLSGSNPRVNGIGVLVVFSILVGSASAATSNVPGTIVRSEDEVEENPPHYVVPYGFYTEAMGTVVGIAGGINGLPQEQTSLFATALASNEGARAAYLFLNDYQTPLHDRLFIDARIGIANFPKLRGYFDLGAPSTPPAGSNESVPGNYVESKGYTDWIEISLKYVLAAGSAKTNPVNVYTLNRGLLAGGASGGEIWNPFVSGRTYVGAKLFYFDRFYDISGGTRYSTSGIDLNFDYNNTDFPINPSRGSKLRLSVKHDPGNSGSTNWTTAEAGFSKYLPLSTGDKTDQRVVALNFWTANTLSENMAPPNRGINLGGLYRMRAFPIERFYDRAAIYYSTEYRVIPRSDLLRNIRLLKSLNLQWWEMVAFYESGRVAPTWDAGVLHSNMKSDVGLGIRILANKNIGRMDIAYSEEGLTFWFMVGHPF